MFGWFSKDTVDKTADNVLDKDDGLLAKAGAWIGNWNFTEEEQAEMRTSIADKASEFVGKTLEEKTERSLTRRKVAIGWIQVQLFLLLLTALAAPYSMPLALFYFDLATSGLMMMGTGSIIAFFFGGYYMNTRAGRKKKDS